MATLLKDWDEHVVEAEEVARQPGFRALRSRILQLAAPQPDDIAVDVGAGTGLLALALAPMVRQVWAIDISSSMLEYLRTKAASGAITNIEVATASAVSLPLVDRSAGLVVSNYCLHHLSEDDKRRALAEMHRVLRPGGRLVIGDMMFQVSLADPRDRKVISDKVRSMLRKGPAGIWRLAKNALRFAGRRWEQPARAAWWERALVAQGFSDVRVEILDHEGGIAVAHRP